MHSSNTLLTILGSPLLLCRAMSTRRSTEGIATCHAEWLPAQMQPSECTSGVLLSPGSTSLSVQKGSKFTVAFQARPGVVITGGSSKLGFMDDPVSCSHRDASEAAAYLQAHTASCCVKRKARPCTVYMHLI